MVEIAPHLSLLPLSFVIFQNNPKTNLLFKTPSDKLLYQLAKKKFTNMREQDKPLNDLPRKSIIAIYPDGRMYQGILIDDLELNECDPGKRQQSYGVKTLTEGGRYEGMFEGSHRTGQGKQTFKDGTCYEGSFVAGKRHGYGTLTYPDGTIFRGPYANDARNGYGQYSFKDGSTYTCMFMDNLQYGKETYMYPDGSIVQGSFSKINEDMLARTKQAAMKAKL
jgi:hypothetical protein